MKKYFLYSLYTLLLVAIACACSDSLDIKRDYDFEVVHLPVQKDIKPNETAEIRCQLKRNGIYDDTKYYMRYFQPDGKGELRMDGTSGINGEPFIPNDLYELNKETFRLYYTSRSEDQQNIDVYFFDSFNNSFTLSFSFNNDKEEEEAGS